MEQQPQIIGTPSIDVAYYFTRFTEFFSGSATNHGGDAWIFLKQVIGVIVGVSIPVAIFFLIAIVITVEGLKKIRLIEEERYVKPPKKTEADVKVESEQARRFKMVMEHVESNNPNDWKQAIMEADIMLDQLLTKLGYQGDSIGEKLKRVSTGDFKTRQVAWDAHLVRNRIAHDGSAFEINHLEAKRTIGLYRQVFDEFYHILEK